MFPFFPSPIILALKKSSNKIDEQFSKVLMLKIVRFPFLIAFLPYDDSSGCLDFFLV